MDRPASKSPLEDDHGTYLVRALNKADVLFAHIPNEGKRSYATAARFRRQGLKRGATDYIIALDEGVCVWLELKRPGGRLSEAQRRFRDRLLKLAHIHITADGYEDALRQLRLVGCPV